MDMKRKNIIQQSFAVPFQYNIVFTEGVFDVKNPEFAETLLRVPSPKLAKVLFVVDQGVWDADEALYAKIKAYSARYSSAFELVGKPLQVPGGEKAKNDPDQVQAVLQSIEAYGIDRHSFVVAIGGGAVLDMVGFAASIAHRGVRLIRIPTTVLSQNDSGIGVKNGVNFFGKKNFLGVFDPPFAVINDALFLRTLEDRDWRAGIAEAIKVALIKDAAFFEKLEADAEAIVERSMPEMQEQIFRCAELHAEHIRGGDPFEKGSSRPLDFGHWAAHKLEQMTDYSLRHGEAVAIGIALDTVYSFLIGILSEKECLRVIRLIANLGFDFYIPELKHNLEQSDHPDSVLRGLEEFREHLGGELTIMLIDSIGHGVEVHEMDTNKLIGAISFLEELASSNAVSSDNLIHF